MKMIIGEREINAKIKEKQQAKKEYEEAKKEGKTASLLEQHLPNVFEMNVANILPGDTIVVEMRYTEMLVPEEGIYQFVYPTVVGPRYTDKDGAEKDIWTQNKYTKEDTYKQMSHSHTFNILLFAASSYVLSENSLEATKKNIKKANKFLSKESGNGVTNLLPALKKALNLPSSANTSKSVIVVTDGYVTVEKEAFKIIQDNLGNANFFSFGIGSDINRYIIEGMAIAGHGEPFFITNNEEAKEKAERFRKYIQSPLLTNISVDFSGFEVYDMFPNNFPDMFAEKPLLVFGKWKGEANGKIHIKGETGNEKYDNSINVSNFKSKNENSALKYLWARHKIMLLSDYNKFYPIRNDEKEEITNLGIKYNLLTEYTSFVAIDQEDRVSKISKVSNTGSVPEPHEWAIIFLIAGLIIFLTLKRLKFS